MKATGMALGLGFAALAFLGTPATDTGYLALREEVRQAIGLAGRAALQFNAGFNQVLGL